MKHIFKQQSGFTLVEMSVVIIVLSFIMVPIFNFMVEQQRHEQQIEAEEVNERVLAALALFVKDNGRYPCPALASLTFGDAAFGHEDCSAPGAAVIQGDLPFFELGVPYNLIYDTHGNKYVYAVSSDETVTTTFTGGGDITIWDENDVPIVDNAPFVVVSLGGDNKGTSVNPANHRIRNNSCNPPGAGNPQDSENCDNDTIFRDMPYSAMQSPDDNDHYDDLIFYDIAREESTLWVNRKNAAGTGMDVTNRNTGNIGIGSYATGAPTDKLEVMGGNMKIDTGDVKVWLGGKVEGKCFRRTGTDCN